MKRASNLIAAVGLAVGLAILAAGCQRRGGEEANPTKTLNAALNAEIKGFDPALANDIYTSIALEQVYETLLDYDYLKRPFELEPLLASKMPEISKDGLTYTVHLRDDVFFHDDPVFGGRPRRLLASDVIFSLKRVADPHLQSPNWWMLEGRVQGLDAFRKAIENTQGVGDYATFPISGMTAPDDRTVVFRLTKPYRQFLYVLATSTTMVVAPEVVRGYGIEFLNHPVGTGPFVLRDWVRGQRIRFERNDRYWDKPYPLLDGVVLWTYIETQPRWLNFLKGNLDFVEIPKEGFDQVFDSNFGLRAEMKSKQITVDRSEEPILLYGFFNMSDPVIGKNRWLRKAISAAVDRETKIRLFYNGRALVANDPIPPSIFGHNTSEPDPNGFSVAKAREWAIKAKEEYSKAHGGKELPPLSFDVINNTSYKQQADLLAQNLAAVGLRMNIQTYTFAQIKQRMNKLETQFAILSWTADYPDAENFLQLLYGQNCSPGANHANFKNPKYDKLYEKMKDLPNRVERQRIINEMVKIIHEEVPWVLILYEVNTPAQHAWLKNYKRHPLREGAFKFLDIDLAEKDEVHSKL
ncbi:MAG: ABC transporter substrate-binding protein [Pseudomonadota bacterium]